MGMIHVTVMLKATQKAKRGYQADFLVDTGATDCVAPAKHLYAAGVKPIGKVTCELADGSPREFEFGTTVIEFMGEITAGRVIFGPDNVEPILGVTALESTGISVNPRTQSLRKLPAIPLKTA